MSELIAWKAIYQDGSEKRIHAKDKKDAIILAKFSSNSKLKEVSKYDK